ncbi:TlpA disulfide reductase family protein [Spongiivirga citrea]|uniref:Redoxin domain-containing protein n=1 Tax=Spongiivirga citrea TaxID=1481457 RepID=A0A6M0CLY2_9FLAO|nr:TlpA disulfide reductase family protein [Spongiivirga citrea]NER17034.1 redoxin domain-containing protein [Spongiivirga citrea]
MKKFILISLLAIVSCAKEEETFLLSGKTNGIIDGTTLYLNDVDSNTVLDSCIVTQDAFEFKFDLKKDVVRTVLHTKDYSNYRFLWLENKPMSFDASATGFREAIVEGSDTETLSMTLSAKMDSIPEKDHMKAEQEFVRDHPESIISANMLAIYTTTWGREKSNQLFENFTEENRTSRYGKKIQRYLDLNKEPKIGDSYIDFEMNDQFGQQKQLSRVRAKLTLLEFWASWCAPCREENPNLVATYKEYNPKGFEVFAVSLDTEKENWLKAIEQDNLPWSHVSELNGAENKAGLIYGVNGIPDNFLIDENGVIVGRNLRGENLDNKIAQLLGSD